MNLQQLEKYSSAVTLSDMEIFVFPELMFSLVLANIMSPIIWKWRQLDCFKKLEGKSSYKKLMRLRQFIMDEYEFNLDLETWGLTSKTKEIKRFEGFITPEVIAQSNALFGYEGDKYYFDVDIRKHFGLDKYNSDIIPYWKTETVEAMDAFGRKKGYTKGAGECVSLSALYVAAAFIVCQIPLEDIYMILTPLHSQNFIDIQDGVLTNNRRLLTKAMWFNGTAISDKAQRALRNENVTIVAHQSGYVHCVYEDATINRRTYEHFANQLNSYLSMNLTIQTFAGFLRSHQNYQKYFQVCWDCRKQAKFIKAEVLFRYEFGSSCKMAEATQGKLLSEVSEEDFVSYELANRIRCDVLEEFLKNEKVDIKNEAGRLTLKKFIEPVIPEAQQFMDELADFIHVEPKLPAFEKNYLLSEPVKISVEQSREQIIEYLSEVRHTNTVADLTFYAYRDMQSCDWRPFIKAAVERNPVGVQMAGSTPIQDVYRWLQQMNSVSIYDDKRLAQPDELANYGTGDGLEKALLLANVIRQRDPQQDIRIVVDNDDVVLEGGGEYRFASEKGLQKTVHIAPAGTISIAG
jgi:hypothetical protein